MKTYNQIHFNEVSCILTQIANGFAAATGHKYIVSDMIYSLTDLSDRNFKGDMKEPFYIAVRKMGTESGSKAHCLERCKGLGYPIVIAKIEQDNICDLNMTIRISTLTDGDWTDMEMEFNSL